MNSNYQQAQENIPPQGYHQFQGKSGGKSSSHLYQSPLYPHGTWALNPNTDPIKYRTSSPDKSLKPSEQSPALYKSPGSSLRSAPVKPFTTPQNQFVSNKQDYLKPPTHRSSNSQVISGENAQNLYDSALRERSMNIQDSQRLSGSRVASSSLDPFTSPKYNKPADFLSPKSNIDKMTDELHTSHDERERVANVQDTKILSARKETDDFINGLLNKYGIGSMKESIETKIVSTDLYSRPRSFASNNGEFPAAVLRSPSSYIEGAKSTNMLSAFYSPPNQSARLYYPNYYSVPKGGLRDAEMYHQQDRSEGEIDTENLSSQFYGQTTGSIDNLEANQEVVVNAKNPYIHIDHRGDHLDNQKFRDASITQANTRRTLDHTVDENTERRQLTEDATQTFGTHQNLEDEVPLEHARDSDNIFETERRSIERGMEGHRMVANTIEDEDNNPEGKSSESNAGSDVGDMSSVVLPEEEEEEAIVEALHQKAESQFYENRAFGNEIHDNNGDDDYHTKTFKDYSQNKHIMVDYLQPPPSIYVTEKENTYQTTTPIINYHYKQQQQFIQTPEPSQVYTAQVTNPYSSYEETRRQTNQSLYNTPQENYGYDKVSPQKQWVSPLQDKRFESPQEEFETSRFKQADFDTFREGERASELPLQQAQVKQPEIEERIINKEEEEERISHKSESLKEKRSEESEVISSEEYEEIEEVEERGSVTAATGKRNMMESVKMWSTFAILVLAIFVWYHLVSISDDWEREIEERFPDLQ